MDEFTKEELELILKSIWWGGDDDETESLQKIDDKIQSMIDNYGSLESIRERTRLHGGVNG